MKTNSKRNLISSLILIIEPGAALKVNSKGTLALPLHQVGFLVGKIGLIHIHIGLTCIHKV